MSKEYYLNDTGEEIQVCRYTFDIQHPNGEEIVVTSRSYGSKSPFSKSEAKFYCHRMMRKFNSKKFRREKPVWLK